MAWYFEVKVEDLFILEEADWFTTKNAGKSVGIFL
jgi:hypothetical protein